MHRMDDKERPEEDPSAGESEVELEPEVYEYIEARAVRAGRTVAAQMEYEFRLNRGLVAADPHDDEGRQRARVFTRMRSGEVLHG